MKIRLIVIQITALLGLFSLLAATSVLAHDPGYRYAYAGIPLTSGISIRGGSYGYTGYTSYTSYTGYTGSVSLGFGYAHHGYAGVPYYGYAQGPAYGHPTAYGYYLRYGHGRRYGRHDRNPYFDRHDRHH